MTNETKAAAGFPKMLRVGEAATILHVHPNTLRKWSSSGLIPSYRIGHRRDRRFKLEDLTNFLTGDAQRLEAGKGDRWSDSNPRNGSQNIHAEMWK